MVSVRKPSEDVKESGGRTKKGTLGHRVDAKQRCLDRECWRKGAVDFVTAVRVLAAGETGKANGGEVRQIGIWSQQDIGGLTIEDD